MRPFIALAIGGSVALACGGTVLGGPGSDGGHSEASGGDGGTCGQPVEEACIETEPTEGSCCTPGQSICETGDPCCVGYVWSCNSTTKTWTKLGLGCTCPREAGADVEHRDASGVSCGSQTCPPGDVCVEDTTSGGPCLAPNDAGMCPAGSTLSGDCCTFSSTTYKCAPEPAGCGGVLSCGCASRLCSCMCSAATGSTLLCECFAP